MITILFRTKEYVYLKYYELGRLQLNLRFSRIIKNNYITITNFEHNLSVFYNNNIYYLC